MASKCMYCKTALPEGTVVDVCDRCGVGVWGEKMFNAIRKNMEDAREDGNLYQGSITGRPNTTVHKKSSWESQTKPQKTTQNPFGSLTDEAMITKESIEMSQNRIDQRTSMSVLGSAQDSSSVDLDIIEL